MKNIRNVVSCDNVAAGGNFTIAIALGKVLEEGDRILNSDQEWIHFALGTKLEPYVYNIIIKSNLTSRSKLT